jgi:arabinan endo-1,5-alpha-L-arabinosidase
MQCRRCRQALSRISFLDRFPFPRTRILRGRLASKEPSYMTSRSTSLVILLGCFTPSAAWAATSGANGSHDPSRMIASNGKFYIYSTGGSSKSSADGLAWTSGPALFPSGIPQSATSVVSNNEGVWAPDVIYLNNQYYLYYALANAQNDCAVGLITSPTLDPSSPSYKWTDHGVVVSNTGSASYCAIDPCPVLDTDGNLWLTWGSGYTKSSTDNTIYLTRLDNTTGLVSTADTAKPGHPLEPGHIEASYLYYHAGYYYLFWNSGGCCDGASSTYEIHVARAQSITGPYSASRIFYQSTGSIHGPGQIGIYDRCGASRFTYHYYPDTGGSVVGENELGWSSDGWPTVGVSSTAPLTACAAQGTGGAAGSGSGGSTGAGGSGGTGAGGVAGRTGTGGAGAAETGAAGAGGTAGPNGEAGAGATGAGGASGLGGATGQAGSGPGGKSGSGGTTGGGAGVTSAGGGTSGAGGGSSTAGIGGAAGSVQGGGNSGAAGTPSESSGAGNGCSCEIGGANGAAVPFFLLLAVANLVGRHRRFSRRSPVPKIDR